MLLTGIERMVWFPDLICRQDARHRLVIAIVAATVAFLSLRGHVRPSTEAIATWDTFVFSVLFLAWLTILTTPVHKLRSRAKEQDVSRFVIFVFVVVAGHGDLTEGAGQGARRMAIRALSAALSYVRPKIHFC